jgi:uncharacterized protein YqgQ
MNLISKNDLFDLVKSLSKSEKRFLKLNAAATGLPANLVALFNDIEHEPEFTEEVFSKIKKLKSPNDDITVQSSETLYNFILQCLRSFHAENNASFVIKDEITNILNLFDKAQYKQCRKILNKQKQEAYRFERFHFILELISLEKLLITIETQFNIKNNTIENLVKESRDVIEKARNLGEYSILFSTINLMARESTKAKTDKELQKVEEYLQSPLLRNTDEIKCAKALIIYHNCRLLLFAKKQDNTNRNKECHLILGLMNDHPEMIEEMPKRYLTAINNLISIAYEDKQFKSCHEFIAQLRSKMNLKAFNTTDLQLKIFTSTYNAELITYTDSGRFDEARKIVSSIEKGLQEFRGKINKEEVLIFYYNIAIMYTYAGNFDTAFKYITRVLSEGDKVLRQDLQSFARIINIGLNYELNNFKQLTYIISSLKVYYKTQTSLFKTEKLILTYIEKLSEQKLTGKGNEKEIFLNFKREVDEQMKDPHEKNVSFYFDIESYLESKIKGLPMNVIMQGKYLKAWQN